MKIYIPIILGLLLFMCFVNVKSSEDSVVARQRRGIFNKCVTDKECKLNEFCDHHWPNPLGDCKLGKPNGNACVLDRHCGSKVCHYMKCAKRRPIKDGPCTDHDECIQEQYCHPKKKKCTNRECSGWCKHSYECMSYKCEFFRCKKIADCKPAKRTTYF